MSDSLNDLEFSTLVDLLRYRAVYQPDKTAFTFLQDGTTETGSLTYQELDRQARLIAASLQPTNAVGERALLLYPPGLEFIAAFFGCLYAGVAAVPAYPPKRNQKVLRLQAIISDAQATAILTTSQVIANIEIQLIENPEFAAMRWLTTDKVDGDLASAWYKPAINRDTLAFLQYTSGSTGTPKGVMVSHGNLLHNSDYIRHTFELTQDSVSVTWLPSYHDMGLIDGIIQPIYTGFPAFLMSPISFLEQPIRWLQAVSKYRATHSGGPNFAYGLCVNKTTPQQRETLDLRCWRTAYNGAEPVRQATLEQFAAAFRPSGFRPDFFYPCYGLAEATLMVTGGLVNEEPIYCSVQGNSLERHRVVDASSSGEKVNRLVGSGRAHLDTKVVIVDPESMKSCPPDQVGEIWVSGPSIAVGYWRRLNETEETFRAYKADTGEGPFLRTGDLGFLRGDELFVTGRLKDMLIVRGRNHYPQDIELAVEQSHPALRLGCGAAFAVTAEDSEQLVVVQEVERSYLDKLDIQEVAGAIRQAIAAEHDLQVYAIVLLNPGKIAKTSSGKIQRHACRSAFLAGTLDEVCRSVLQPGDEAHAAGLLTREEILASEPEKRRQWLVDYLKQVVLQVLKVSPSQLDLNQSLLQLGIDSLMATEVKHRLEIDLGVVVPLEDFLQEASVKHMAGQVLALLHDSSRRELTPLVTPPQTAIEYPLSQGQQALWFIHQTAPESAAYNVFFAVRILSELDEAILVQAFQTLSDRHPALRTTFATVNGQPVQRIQERLQLDFETTDAAAWSLDELNQYLLESSHRPFDLQKGPLMRVRLCRRGAKEHILLFTANHIVIDFWSLVVMLDELRIVYPALKAQQPVHLPPVDWQPVDYVYWQAEMLAGSAGERLWRYWQKQLAGASPRLNLPADKPRPPVQNYRGAAHTFQWDEEFVERLRGLAKSQGTTLYTLLLAAFQVLLHRYTGQEDILVGSSVAGRGRAELAGTVGYLANQLVLRADLSGDPRFQEFLRQMRQTVLGALAHQDYPFPLLVKRLQPERDSSHSPLFQVMFVIEKSHRLQELASLVSGDPGASMDFGGLQLESVALEQRVAQFDLTLMLVDGKGGMTASWQYNSDLFEAATVSRMSGHMMTLLEALASDPDQHVAGLPLLSAPERQQMLVEWNRTLASYPTDRCLHQLFEAQAAQSPEATAVVSAGESISYRELNRRANRLANRLRGLGVREEVLVGVCLRRSIEMVVGLLGVLKAGGGYVPMDVSYPRQRKEYMAEDAGVRVVITRRGEWEDAEGGLEVVYVDDESEETSKKWEENPVSGVASENLAYVIYTSGSTGKPKGTMITHRGLVNYLCWCIKEYAVADGAGAPVSSSIGFDATITSLFSPLLVGKRLALLPEQQEIAALSAALCSEDDFSLVKITPAHLDLLRYSLPAEHAQVHTAALIVGGEPLSVASLEYWQAHAPDTRIINEYGPTESVVGCCIYEVTPQASLSGVVPIGRPIANVEIYLLDSHLQPVPIGVTGELCIGGDGLARGYLNRPNLTAEKFIPHPFSTEQGARIYRTGDLARYLPDGTIEFLGRKDDQVKIRGFRIELGEIEAALLQHPEVRETAVNVCDDESGNKRLIAYVVPHTESAAATTTELRRYLAEKLPQYMLPSAFVSLKELPLTSNGKVDRRVLPQPDNLRPELEGAFVFPATEVERIIATAWQEALHLDKVGIYDNFFELGGHSLLAAQVHHRLQERLGQEIPIIELLQYPTVSSLAKRLSQREEKSPDFRLIHDRAQKQKQAMNSQKKVKGRRKSLSPNSI